MLFSAACIDTFLFIYNHCILFLQAAFKPIKFVLIPLKFLVERVLVVSCLNYETKQSTQDRLGMVSQQSQRFSAFSSRNKAFSSKSRKVPSKSQKLVPRNSNHGDEEEFPDTIGFSVKQPSAPPHSEDMDRPPVPMSLTEKLQAGGGLTKRNKAVSFRSTKIALDENYKDELDHDQAEFSLSTKFQEYTAK